MNGINSDKNSTKPNDKYQHRAVIRINDSDSISKCFYVFLQTLKIFHYSSPAFFLVSSRSIDGFLASNC